MTTRCLQPLFHHHLECEISYSLLTVRRLYPLILQESNKYQTPIVFNSHPYTYHHILTQFFFLPRILYRSPTICLLHRLSLVSCFYNKQSTLFSILYSYITTTKVRKVITDPNRNSIKSDFFTTRCLVS